MCRLKIKARIIGKKNQEFVRFILTPKNIRQKGKYKTSLGYWDTRKNKAIKILTFNIYEVMVGFFKGATPNNTVLKQLYYYFVEFKNLNNWFYFKETQVRLFIENEIKKKHL